MRNAIFLAVLFLFSVVVSPAQAKCIKCGEICHQLGVTMLDKDANGKDLEKPEAIIACLKKEGSSDSTCTGETCVWKPVGGGDVTGYGYDLSLVRMMQFHDDCKVSELNYINCSSACSRFCRDSCATGKGQTESINCAGGVSGLNYEGGLFSGWVPPHSYARCVCYN